MASCSRNYSLAALALILFPITIFGNPIQEGEEDVFATNLIPGSFEVVDVSNGVEFFMSAPCYEYNMERSEEMVERIKNGTLMEFTNNGTEWTMSMTFRGRKHSFGPFLLPSTTDEPWELNYELPASNVLRFFSPGRTHNFYELTFGQNDMTFVESCKTQENPEEKVYSMTLKFIRIQ